MSPSRSTNLRFTQVRLENWRNFVHADVELAERAFLVGPNASGKSNLLDVFRFLHDLVSVGGGFQEAIRRRSGLRRIRSLAARRSPDVRIEVAIGTESDPRLWTYELRVEGRDAPRVARERVTHDGKQLLIRPNKSDRGDESLLSQTYVEQSLASREFRQVVAFFESIRYIHIVPQLVREPERTSSKTRDDPYGGDFLEQIGRTNRNVQRGRLRRIRQALVVAVPQLEDLEFWRDPNTNAAHLRGRYQHWRAQGAWQTEEQFSDGTLRLIGLLWAALDAKAGPLLLEEPELSLHPDIVRFMPQMFARIQRQSGRQILVSTHSPDLLRDEGIGLNEVLLLEPETEGTAIRPASAFADIVALLQGGLNLADAAVPHTRPKGVRQLALFPGER